MRAAQQKKNKRRRIISSDDSVDGENVDEEEELEEGTATHVESNLAGGSAEFLSSGTASKKKKLVISKKLSQTRGPMDAYTRPTPEEVVAQRHLRGPYQATMENRMRSEDERNKVRGYLAAWAYECGIPFNAFKARSFEVAIEAVGQFGPGFKPPSCHDFRVPLLKSEKEKIDDLKKQYQTYWRRYGCTLIFDGWTYKKGRHLINFLVNCPEGTFFLRSIDASSERHDANYLFKLLDSKVEEIGEQNVTQVVTNNAANYATACRLLMEKRKKLFWTPCAAHCINLMMEEIGNIKSYKSIIVKARKITTFIYRHTRVLEAMRVKIGGADLVRPAATRFASSFLTLQSLLKHKDALRRLFLCEEWDSSRFSQTEAGKQVVEIILALKFWNGVQDCLRASLPLLQVLRIVDGDERPAMPEVYSAMEEAKKSIIANFKGVERKWKKIIKIIERHWIDQMERPIYLASFFLNPGKFFKDCALDEESSSSTGLTLYSPLKNRAYDAFRDVVVKLVPDPSLQDKIIEQAIAYVSSKLNFGHPMAIRQREKLSPLDWWQINGNSTPELTSIAKRLLGLCCSSSCCERNWSTYDFIHTKRRNFLEHHLLNDLVYIQFNRRLQRRYQERREQGRNYNPLVLDELDWTSEWLTGQSDDDEELVHPENDLTWREVSMASGASSSFQGHNRPRRQEGSTSGVAVVAQPPPNLKTYQRRSTNRNMVRDEQSSDDEEQDQEVLPNVDDDLDVEDDYGMRLKNPARQQEAEEEDQEVLPNVDDDLDDEDEEQDQEVLPYVDDDLDVEDDYGMRPKSPARQQEAEEEDDDLALRDFLLKL